MKINKKSKKYLLSVKRQVSHIIKDTLFPKQYTNIFLHEFRKDPTIEYLIVPDIIGRKVVVSIS
jgi:hypothetical protein